jgi:hypothetical protein
MKFSFANGRANAFISISDIKPLKIRRFIFVLLIKINTGTDAASCYNAIEAECYVVIVFIILSLVSNLSRCKKGAVLYW